MSGRQHDINVARDQRRPLDGLDRGVGHEAKVYLLAAELLDHLGRSPLEKSEPHVWPLLRERFDEANRPQEGNRRHDKVALVRRGHIVYFSSPVVQRLECPIYMTQESSPVRVQADAPSSTVKQIDADFRFQHTNRFAERRLGYPQFSRRACHVLQPRSAPEVQQPLIHA